MSYREPDPESKYPPVRPWTLTLEVVHLSGPAFDLDRHGETVAAEIAGRLADVILKLPGGARVRIETYMDTTNTTTRTGGTPVRSHPDDTPDTTPEPAYQYYTLLNEARAGRLSDKGFREAEELRTAHPELAEDDQ